MAEDPIGVVDQFWAAFNARDHERALGLLDPEAELRPMRAQLEGRAYIGHDGYRQLVADVEEDWENLQVVVEDRRAAGEDVTAITRLQGRGRVSGVDLDVPVGWHYVIREGTVVYGRAYSNPDDAVRAAGLE
ncbi:MAG TPA: nuclear transport factor 2 family protein [Solirubrobacterales bacterium]|nr:nuclear transport factor 2 family protein [Solirubrobacterales bacterium]